MADITLVNLSYSFKEREDPQSLVPLGSLYLIAALERKGYRVDFRDYQLNRFDEPFRTESLVTFMERSGDMLGVSCCSDLLPFALAALERVKAGSPGKRIILGGVGPTGVAEQIVELFPFIDIVVVGEGERTLVDLVDIVDSVDFVDRVGLVPGIVFCRDGVAFRTASRPRILDLDGEPFPAFHVVDLGEYQVLGLVSARGCPFRCGFCDAAPFWEYRVSRRSVDCVVREIKEIHSRFPGKNIQLYDETFTLSKGRVLAFCRRLKEEGLDVRWSVMTRVDLMDEELMEAMADSGCFMVLYGIESGSDRVLAQMGKRYTVAGARETIKRSLDYFWVWTPVIWGFPFESMEDFFLTLDFVEEVTADGAVPLLYQLAPFPLSPLYSQYKETLEFSPELYRSCHLIHNPEVMELIESYPTVFSGFCHYRPGHVPAKYPEARLHGSIPFLP
jgi:radical SAM superfamily enzyme YgiQ (UPF0313 family)